MNETKPTIIFTDSETQLESNQWDEYIKNFLKKELFDNMCQADLQKAILSLDFQTIEQTLGEIFNNECEILNDIDIMNNDPLTFFLLQQITYFLIMIEKINHKQDEKNNEMTKPRILFANLLLNNLFIDKKIDIFLNHLITLSKKQ